jgi:CheY-like chemotaxis protein
MMAENPYDIVLMDLFMPVMDGYTATREIRKFNTETPVIALTASSTDELRGRILEAGMQDYVTKPFDIDILYTKIEGLLAS